MKRLLFLLAVCLASASAVAADARSEFLKLIDRPRVPLAAQADELPGTNGFRVFHFAFNSEQGQRVTGLLVKSTNYTRGKQAVVITLHGTGGSKQSVMPLMQQLAARGFIAVAIDGRYHGERSKSGKGSAEYQDAIFRAWRNSGEHPFFYDTVWDVMRLVDYLKTRDDVDAKRIGLIGISKGGIETYLAAAVDKRIAVAVPCIGVQSFGWALENDAWHSRIGTIQAAFDLAAKDAGVTTPDAAFVRRFYDRVAPGIYDRFDGPAMLPLIAPRPLLTINGDSDDRTPLPGLQLCTDAAAKAYRSARAEDRFIVRIQEKTGHRVTPESEKAAVEWFVKWLRPGKGN